MEPFSSAFYALIFFNRKSFSNSELRLIHKGLSRGPIYKDRLTSSSTDQEKWQFMYLQFMDMMYWFTTSIASNNDILTMSVGSAAVNMLYSAINGEKYDCTKTDFAITEGDIGDWYEWDTASMAMASYSDWVGVAPNKDKQKEFWEWWLKSAIPQAYERF